MNSILGIYQRQGYGLDRGILSTLLAANGNQNCDGSGVWVGSGSGLGSQYSWLTPEEIGEEQPLTSRDGTIILSADLRLDNREELARELGVDLQDARTLSDSRILLLAYQRWSTACVERLLGDFAFALWDEQRQHLFAARDPLGVSLLYYYDSADLFITSSDIATLLAHPALTPAINEGMVAEYLAGLWDNEEESFFAGVFYCPPGHCLLASATGLKKWCYWDIDPALHLNYGSEQAYADHYYELLRQAVQCRMRGTGDIGIALSGGLDSAPIAALAAEILPFTRPAQTELSSFSCVFDKFKTCDERRYIEPLVEKYKIETHYVLGDDLWPLRDLANWPVLQEPISFDPFLSQATAMVEEAKNSGCRILLAGYYGDYLYTGSDYWAADLIYDRRWKTLLSFTARQHRQFNWRREFFDNGLAHLLGPTVRRFFPRRQPEINNPAWKMVDVSLAQRTNLADRAWIQPDYKRFHRPAGWYRLQRLTPAYARKTMARSRARWSRLGVERYDVFLDRRLVEFAMAVPAYQLGLPGAGNNRRIMRQAMKGTLPETIRCRKGKTSLDELYQEGIMRQERQTIEKFLADPAIVHFGYVDPQWLAEILPRGCDLTDDGLTLLRCVALELWLQRYWVH